MKNGIFSKKMLAQAAAAASLLLLLLLGVSAFREYGIGQKYQRVLIDGQVIGCTSAGVNVKDVFLAARRELAAEADERLRMDYEWSVETADEPFVRLLGTEELKESLKAVLTEKIISGGEQAYTVAIGSYRGNFASLEEVQQFLNQVKAETDGDGAFTTEVSPLDGHISGILTAGLTENRKEASGEEEENDAAVFGGPYAGALSNMAVTWDGLLAEEASSPSAGVFLGTADALEEVSAVEKYQTGILDMEFVECVEIYENYVAEDELTNIGEAVAEVTKEKESNKIYVVESGDCLSVIAMDNNTSVSSIVALNGLSDADAIREGQELIIAVPEPDLKLRVTVGEVYEEDYEEEPVIIENDSWYTTREVVLEEGTVGHRERNDVVVYENGMEISRELVNQRVMSESQAAVIERGTVIPPTYIKPISGGHFTSGFGYRWGRLHKGVDWGCPVGTTVFASCGGTVIQASYNGGYGNNVVISHPDGRMTRYAHNSKLLVSVGQTVEQGEPIALSGNTGRSTGPHVHFEIYIDGVAVNPLNYISN